MFQHLYGFCGGQIGIYLLHFPCDSTQAKSGHKYGFDVGQLIVTFPWTYLHPSLVTDTPPLGHCTYCDTDREILNKKVIMNNPIQF